MSRESQSTRTAERPFELPAGSTDASTYGTQPMAKKKREFRVVSRGEDGDFRTKSYETIEPLLELHPQIGVDDCSTNLSLRGLPVFRGLIGPIGDQDGAVRYESPEVFEALTKTWAIESAHKGKRRRRKPVEVSEADFADFTLDM